MTHYLNFRDEGPRERLHRWWRSLEHDRGGRAELRRCRSAEQVAFVPAFHALLGPLEAQGLRVERDALARVAGLAAHVRHHVPAKSYATVGAQLGTPPKKGARSPMSDLRFRRLLATEPGDELYVQMRRALALVDGKVDLTGLAHAVYSWGPAIRKQWAYDYYAKAPKPQTT